jgi:putative ABC transport system permease protein
MAAAIGGSLGAVGLLLAGIGIYGVTAYMVTRRAREFGIRLALGATRGDIVRLVLVDGLWLVVAGSAIGLALAAAASHVVAGFLLGIGPVDPATFLGAAALFGAVGVGACYGSARRAMRIDPAGALRCE